MFKRIDHVEIISRDLEKSIDFYQNVLGFKVKQRQRVEVPPLEEVVYLGLGDTTLELLSVKEPGSLSLEEWKVGYRMMAVEVDDMNRAVDYLKSKGIEITR